MWVRREEIFVLAFLAAVGPRPLPGRPKIFDYEIWRILALKAWAGFALFYCRIKLKPVF
jgi:hypothetical protein